MRQAAPSTSASAGASGMKAQPIVNPSIPTSIVRPTPSRRSARPARTAPTNAPAPPSPAMTPIAAGPSPTTWLANSRYEVPKIPHMTCDEAPAAAIARRIGDRPTSRSPSRISRRTGSRSDAGRRAGSGRRIEPRKTADTRNETASTAMASGALNSWMRKPLIPNAENSATDALAVSALFAVTSSWGSTTVGR